MSDSFAAARTLLLTTG